MEVVIIKDKYTALLTLFIIIIFSFSITNQVIVRAATVDGEVFSSNLIAEVELSWKLTKYDYIPQNFIGEYSFPVKDGVEMSEGDIFKVKLLKDLNEVSLDSCFDLYCTDIQWGEFFLNDSSLGKNASAMYWFGPDKTIESMITAPILPVTIELSTGTENYFDYIADNFESLPADETEDIEIKNTKRVFSMKKEIHEVPIIWPKFTKDYELEVVYNKEWGILVKYDLFQEVYKAGVTRIAEILYETEIKDIKVPYSWTFSFVALFVTGIAVLTKRKHRSSYE